MKLLILDVWMQWILYAYICVICFVGFLFGMVWSIEGPPYCTFVGMVTKQFVTSIYDMNWLATLDFVHHQFFHRDFLSLP